MSIVLIGARGSGKSSIGRHLAGRLGHPFIDVDDRIVELAGKNIKRIFEEDGEPHFRDIETRVVHEVTQLKDHVIGLGGGTLMREVNQQALRLPGHRLIYLRCDASELLRRVQSDPKSGITRPNLTVHGGGLQEIEHLLSLREPIYRKVADVQIDVTKLTIEQAAAKVLKAVQPWHGFPTHASDTEVEKQ